MRRLAGRPLARRGFTLVELIVATGISSILLIAMSSVVLLASRAIPSEASASGRTMDTTLAVGDLRLDLLAADRILELTDRSIAFTVPDRDGDGWPEQIRYAWSGTPGDPLQRSLGGGTPVDVLDDVRDVHLVPERIVRTERFPDVMVNDDGEQLVLDTSAPSYAARVLVRDQIHGQVLTPRLGADVVAWQPTRIAVLLDRAAIASDAIEGELRDVVDGNPGSVVLDTDFVPPAVVLDQVDWWTFAFPSSPVLPRDADAAIVLEGDMRNAWDASLAYWSGGDGQSGRVFSLDGKASWTRSGGQALACRVLARQYRSPGVRSLHHVAASGLTVRIEREGSAPLDTTIELPGRPPLIRQQWICLPFEADPIEQDRDGDGTADWTLRGGGTFDVSGDPIIEGAVESRLDLPHVIEFRGRCESDMSSVTVEAHADSDGSGSMPVLLELVADSSGRQSLSVRAGRGGAVTTLTSVVRPVSESVSARLIVDPVAAGVHVVIDGRDFGTWPLERIESPPPHRGITVDFFSRDVREAEVIVTVPEPLP